MPCTTTASKKQKGRKFQQTVRNSLRVIGISYGLEDDDIVSTSMGVSGIDIILSPAARKLFDWYIECKAVESLNVSGIFYKHFAKYKDKAGLKLLFHTRNRVEPLVTLRMEDFMQIITDNLTMRNQIQNVN